MGQQFGADIKLQECLLASLSPQRLPHQPGARAQIGPGAGGKVERSAQVGQAPGHPLLQAGMAGISGGVAAEAAAHSRAKSCAI
jgi:hypothetical protein